MGQPSNTTVPVGQHTPTKPTVQLTDSMERFQVHMRDDFAVIITAPAYRGHDGGNITVSAVDLGILSTALHLRVLPALHEAIDKASRADTASYHLGDLQDPNVPTK